METGKRNFFALAWSVIWPIVLYDCLGMLIGLASLFRWPFYTSFELTLLVGVVTALVFGLIYYGDRKRLGYELRSLHLADIPALIKMMICSAVLAVAGNIIIAFTPLVEWSKGFQEVSEAMNQESFLIMLLVSVLAAPLSEELLVRGVIFGRMRSFLSARTAIVLSSLLFGIMHANLVQGVYAFFMGILFAAVMERFQNILAPILAHMSANLIIVLLSF